MSSLFPLRPLQQHALDLLKSSIMAGEVKKLPPIDRLKQVLHYAPETGQFTRLLDPVSRECDRKRWAGKPAGKLDGGGYVEIFIDGARYKAHRIAWLFVTGEEPEFQIDHVNLKRDDNRWLNLRLATNQQNQVNTPLRKDNTSGYKGVVFVKECTSHPWLAQIQTHGRHRKLGYFKTREEAHARYCSELGKEFGEYARFK